MTATATSSLAIYSRALDILRQEATKARTDPLAALIGILLRRNDVPVLGAAGHAGSRELSDLLYDIFGKRSPFDLGYGASAYLDLFADVKTRGANDWRNAFASQKGLGCFATDAELQQPAFRHQLRDQCVHRGWDAGAGDYLCDLSAGTTCKSQRQAAGEVSKTLKAIPVNQNRYGYQRAPLSFGDLEKLVPAATKIAVLPVMAAIYSGATSAPVNRVRPFVTVTDFLDDLGLTGADASAVFDLAPTNPFNHEVIRMTEPYLLSSLRAQLHDDGFVITLPDLINFHLSLKTRAFVILSGISGTGKSLLPRRYAEKLDLGNVSPDGNLEVVPIRPGWNDLADLLGYYNSIHGGFEPGPAIPAIRRAVAASDNHGPLAAFLVLDEMNLARIEHYFADFLSVTESRYFDGTSWRTDPLRLAASRTGLVNFVGATASTAFVDSIPAELELPDNLFVVGTINIDETTHGISSKVLDRANSIEFESISLTTPTPPTAPQGYQAADLHLLSHFLTDRAYRTFADISAAQPQETLLVVQRLVALHAVLEPFRLHFGLRTRDEVCAYMGYAEDLIAQAVANGVDLEGYDRDQAFDRQVLQKVLPRVSGTREELQHTTRGNLFDKLTQVLTPWNCTRSLAKIARMRDQEIVNFWEA